MNIIICLIIIMGLFIMVLSLYLLLCFIDFLGGYFNNKVKEKK